MSFILLYLFIVHLITYNAWITRYKSIQYISVNELFVWGKYLIPLVDRYLFFYLTDIAVLDFPKNLSALTLMSHFFYRDYNIIVLTEVEV